MTSLREGSDKGGLRGWFEGGGWDRYDSKGNKIGKCGDRKPGEAKPKCFSREKAAALGKKGRAQAVRRKRREDPNPNAKGKPINTPSTKKGLKKRKKRESMSDFTDGIVKQLLERTKKKKKAKKAAKKDACYHKVKATASKWPSAYASGRLVQCRNKGASNYGKSNSSTDIEGNSLSEIRGRRAYQRVRQAQQAAKTHGVQRPYKASAKDLLGAEKYTRRKSRRRPDYGTKLNIDAADAENRAQQQISSTEIIGNAILEALKCWKGYKRVKGKTPGTPGSCTKVSEENRSDRPDVNPNQPNATTLPRERGGRAKPPKDDDFDPEWNPNDANNPKNKPQRFKGRRGPVIGSYYRY